MRSLDNNISAFFALVRAGLWEKEVRLSPYMGIDFARVFRLAVEQSVVGLVAAGLEHVSDVKLPKESVLQFVGETMQLERRNQSMNDFIGVLVEQMGDAGIYTLIVKGQGIAQCYERPLWRACGDVDFFLNEENYPKAKSFLIPLSRSVNPEGGRHLGMTIGTWVVELHGNLHCGLSPQMDRVIDAVQKDVFDGGNVRTWMNGKTEMFLPSPNNDLILIFTHFLKHFYKGGLGIRQICDWCRLLWTYRDSIDPGLLTARLRAMRLETAWQAFGAYAVHYLGMPPEAIPLYDASARWKKKAKRIQKFILMSGNFGHNRYNGYRNYPFFIRKAFSMGRRIGDLIRHMRIFPLDSLRYMPSILLNGVKAAAKGVG